MAKKQSFVFFSKKRWVLLKLFTVIFLILLATLSFFTYQSYSQSPFNKVFPDQKNRDIVDQISVKLPNEIRVEGSGPILTLEKAKNGEFYLKRSSSKLKEKTVFLTFDDGPDPIYTQKVLDILSREKVKATFFLVGQNIYKYPEITKQIVKEGHLIGAHTFSHYSESFDLYRNSGVLVNEFELTRVLIEEYAHYSSQIFRLPYLGAEKNISMNNLVLTVEATQRGYKIIDVDIDPRDWEAKNSQAIVDSIKTASEEKTAPVVLLHDGGGIRENTVSALPEIIAFYKYNGYKFSTIQDLFGSESLTKPIKKEENLISNIVYLVYDSFASLPATSSRILILGLILFGAHTIFVSSLAITHKIREKKTLRLSKNFHPKVSVVIPIFNEEKVIEGTILSVLGSDYDNYELILVDDGSTDRTSLIINILQRKFGKIIKIVSQENRGKFAALNNGIAHSQGEIIVAIDADTQIIPKTITALVKHFRDPAVGAVAGNIKVGNQVNLLTLLQEVDYRMALNLERRAFSLLNAAYVVPGAVGGWRREALEKVGGYTDTTLTEDAEAGMRIRKLGYKINYESKAIAYTEAPTDLPSLIRQRFRWTFGSLQTLWLHKDMVFNPQYGYLGLLVLPYTVFVQIPSMMIAPIVELAAIPAAVFFSVKVVLISITALLVGRILLFILASKLDGEDTKLSALIIPYRFFYQVIWYFVLNYSLLIALKGSFITWKKMNHLGSFGLENVEAGYTYSLGSDIKPKTTTNKS